jgi:hypothetical protein
MHCARRLPTHHLQKPRPVLSRENRPAHARQRIEARSACKDPSTRIFPESEYSSCWRAPFDSIGRWWHGRPLSDLQRGSEW